MEFDGGAEVEGGAWSLSCGSGEGNSPTGRLHTKLHPPHPLAKLVEVRRLRRAGWPRRAGSVAAASTSAARRQRGGGGQERKRA
jgi:hypothetical protein